MPQKENSLKVLPSSVQSADIMADAVLAFTQSLPTATSSPESLVLAAGGNFVTARLTKMSSEFIGFLQDRLKKKNLDKSTPIEQFAETVRLLESTYCSDEDYISALRNLHILTLDETLAQSEELKIYTFIEIARGLSAPELSVVLSTYRIDNSLFSPEKMGRILRSVEGNKSANYAMVWARMVAVACEFPSPEYVLSMQRKLEEKYLIVPRMYNSHGIDGRGDDYQSNKGSRLTNLGISLAEFVEKGAELFQEKGMKCG